MRLGCGLREAGGCKSGFSCSRSLPVLLSAVCGHEASGVSGIVGRWPRRALVQAQSKEAWTGRLQQADLLAKGIDFAVSRDMPHSLEQRLLLPSAVHTKPLQHRPKFANCRFLAGTGHLSLGSGMSTPFLGGRYGGIVVGSLRTRTWGRLNSRSVTIVGLRDGQGTRGRRECRACG